MDTLIQSPRIAIFRIGNATVYCKPMARVNNYLLDRHIELDDNEVEYTIRPIALSRKNFLFYGNHRSAEDTAVICSLLVSCKELELNPREYN